MEALGGSWGCHVSDQRSSAAAAQHYDEGRGELEKAAGPCRRNTQSVKTPLDPLEDPCCGVDALVKSTT